MDFSLCNDTGFEQNQEQLLCIIKNDKEDNRRRESKQSISTH